MHYLVRLREKWYSTSDVDNAMLLCLYYYYYYLFKKKKDFITFFYRMCSARWQLFCMI